MPPHASTSTYAERLWPATWVWVAALLVAASSGLVVQAVLAPVGALLVVVVAVGGAAAALVGSSARVQVASGELLAARAHIPVALLGRVRVLDGTAMTLARGRRADARAFVCQRGWIRGGVVVEVTDPQDPVPYWLISSRTPQRLVAAIEQARAEPPSGSPGQAHSRQTG